MKTSTLVLLLCGGAALLAPDADAQTDSYGWGPGEPGECVILTEGEGRFMIGSYLVYRVVGNSVYREERYTCTMKIIDLPFPVDGIDIVGWGRGEHLLFWSDQSAYRCRVNGDSLEPINAYGLLSGFLVDPIERASATEGHYGCSGGSEEEVDHDVVRVAVPSLLHQVSSAEERSEERRQINGIDLEDLTWALRSVNTDPWRMPSLDAFEIDEGDLRTYAERVAADLKSLSEDDHYYGPLSPDNRDIFIDLPALLDTIGPEVVRAALIDYRTQWLSNGGSSYGVILVNTAGDTLHCSFVSSGPIQPFCLPWTIRYGDMEFQTYSVELARLLTGLLPANEYRTEQEQKIELLYAIAEYLGKVRSRRE